MQRDNSSRLETSRYLDLAEWEYLVDGKTEFVFPVRRKSGDADYYERLEQDLREQEIMRVHSFREVKEAFTWISRPASLSLSLDTLIRERPHLPVWRSELESLSGKFNFIDLRAFLRLEGRAIAENLVLLRSCLEVLSYLITNRHKVSGLLPRQLPHGQSTKLIGRETLLLRLFAFWRGEPAQWRDFFFCFELLDKPLEFRFYAPACTCQDQSLRDFHGLLARDWVDQYRFGSLTGSLIVENFESFLALTRESKSTFLVWGAGWRAVHLRVLLQEFPKPIYYWGDIDKEGYEIYASLKHACPELQPILMDQATIERNRNLQQRKDLFIGPFREVPGLQGEYEYVSRHGVQIEQEQIHERWPFGTELD